MFTGNPKTLEIVVGLIPNLRARGTADLAILAELGPRYTRDCVQEALDRINGNGGNGKAASPPPAAPADVTMDAALALVREDDFTPITDEAHARNMAEIDEAITEPELPDPEKLQREEAESDDLQRILEANLDIKSDLLEPEIDERIIETFSDTGNAERMCRYYGSRLHYSDEWLVWTGKKWDRDANATLQKMAKRVVRSIHKEADKAPDKDKKKIRKHAIHSESNRSIKDMLCRLQTEENKKLGYDISIEHELLDASPRLFNVANGTYNLDTNELQPHNRRDLITRISPIVYDPDATCELLDDFLKGNLTTAVAAYLRRCVGYCLTGENPKNVFFYLYGPGGGGKSTLCSALISMFGEDEYAATCDVSTFTKMRSQSPARADIYRLRGSRIVIAAETPKDSEMNEAVVKAMRSSGRELVARDLWKGSRDIKTFRAGVLWLHGNKRLQVPADDTGLRRSLIVIPFNKSRPELTDQDPKFIDGLSDPKIGGPALLAWAIRGYQEYRELGLEEPEEVKLATRAYWNEMIPSSEWIQEECNLDPGNRSWWTSFAELYGPYEADCRRDDIQPVSKTQFGLDLKALNLEEKKGGSPRVRGYIGIRLNPERARFENLNENMNSISQTSPKTANLSASNESVEPIENNSNLPF